MENKHQDFWPDFWDSDFFRYIFLIFGWRIWGGLSGGFLEDFATFLEVFLDKLGDISGRFFVVF